MLPTRLRAYNVTADNELLTPVSNELLARQILYGVKTHWLQHPNLEVVGSYNDGQGWLDGEDRWQSPEDLDDLAWIILRAAQLGGAQILLLVLGDCVKLALAPSGYQLVHGQPWATDELVLAYAPIATPAQVTTPWYWSAGYASDGASFWFCLMSAGNVQQFTMVQAPVSAVLPPAQFEPAVIGFSMNAAALEARGHVNMPRVLAHINDTVCRLYIGGEGYSGVNLATELQTTPTELQAGYLIQPLSLWSETPGARGKVADLVDVWAVPAALRDGVTLPLDGAADFIVLGQLLIPWDGHTAPRLD